MVELCEGVPGGAGRAPGPGLHHRGHPGAGHQPAQAQLGLLRAADIIVTSFQSCVILLTNKKLYRFYWGDVTH